MNDKVKQNPNCNIEDHRTEWVGSAQGLF